MMAISTTDTVKFRDANVRRSSNARSCRCSASWRTTNATSPPPPIVSGTHAGKLCDAVDTPSRLRPYTLPPKPTADNSTEPRSRGASRGVVTFSMRRTPSTSAATAIGNTSTNSHRHGRKLRIIPETAGPSAGATEITIMRLPIVLPRDSGGTRVMTVVINSGNMIAVPDA